MDKTYIGDGLYASYDGYMFLLSTDRMGVLHYVALEPDVLDSFFRFIERTWKVKITMAKEEEVQNG